MRFVETPLAGAFVITPEPIPDERGFFARTFCVEAFEARGMDARVDQCSLSFNERRGTLRGLHFQVAPHGEAKLVSCVQGAIWDVIVDLRAGPSFGRWFATGLRASDRTMLFVPAGLAHGFQTLEDATTVAYQISSPHRPEAARGILWSDPTLALPWPIPQPIVSARDSALGLFPPSDG